MTRGQRRISTDEQIMECFSSMIAMANDYSPVNPDAPLPSRAELPGLFVQSAQLLSFVKGNVLPDSKVSSDGWKGHNGLEKDFVHHRALSAQSDNKESVLPGVHLVVSLVKRVILEPFQGRFDPDTMQRYLNEYVFRFNRRTCRSPGKRFWRIIQQAVSWPPLTNRQLRLGLT